MLWKENIDKLVLVLDHERSAAQIVDVREPADDVVVWRFLTNEGGIFGLLLKDLGLFKGRCESMGKSM